MEMEEACAKVVQTPSIAHALGQQAEQARLTPARAEETLGLPHAYWGRNGRLRRSLCEAVFEPCPEAGRWRLRAEYEPFMDSPLFGLQADRFESLLKVGLVGLGVRAAQPGQGWRLEQVALHPDCVEPLELGGLEP
ncbi:MAG: hypothetical protein SFU83_11115 [Meiothermus sp.]|nr:hypothetical protein [Meiothermus sp.]